MIAVVFSLIGVYSIATQRVGHLIFGRIYGSQAIGLGVVSLGMGGYSLWLYLSAASRGITAIRTTFMFFVAAYLVALSLPFVALSSDSTGAHPGPLLIVSLLVLLIAGHALHRRLLRVLPAQHSDDPSKKEDR